MTRKFAIGTDIGGSHISCSLIDLEGGKIIPGTGSYSHVNNKGSADEIMTTWSETLARTMAFTDPKHLAGIGFAMPGPFDYANGIAMFTPEVVKYEHLFGINVASELKRHLGTGTGIELRFINDASAFAIGEAWIGRSHGVKRSVAITLGTGFGSAFVYDGIPVVDGDDVPSGGCVWHIPYNGGIADDSFSTRWFVRQYALKSGQTLAGVREIAVKAETDQAAREIFKEFGHNLGGFLGPWLKKFEAGMLVIGGNVCGAWSFIGNFLEDSLKMQKLQTQICLSILMEDAAITGSARLLEPKFWSIINPVISKM